MIETLLPEIQKIFAGKTIDLCKKNGQKITASQLYYLLPSQVRLLITEKAFVNFYLMHQENMFSKPIKAKRVTKKASTKKAVNKLPAKKLNKQ